MNLKEVIQNGGLVIFPTETVWGIGANAYNLEACKKIYAVKNRPSDNPLIVHLHSLEQLTSIVYVDSELLQKLSTWMPGPLTAILPKKDPHLFSCSLPTLGVRIPSLPEAQNFLQEVQTPIAAPSCNLSGKPSLTSYKRVCYQFKDKVDAILEGPQSSIGLESTVVDFSKKDPIYLRPGSLSFEELKKTFPNLKKRPKETSLDKPLSPGLNYPHYAPNGQVILCSDLKDLSHVGEAAQMGFTLSDKTALDRKVHSNQEYAKELYEFFCECDTRQIKRLYLEEPLKDDLYLALMDRIEKASKA